MSKIFTTLILLLISTNFVHSNDSSPPFQFSLTPDVAVFHRAAKIKGLILNVWGENPQRALTLGIVNGSLDKSSGLSLGFLVNYSDSYNGLQVAPVNFVAGDFNGGQLGFANYAERLDKGVQIGFVNFTETMNKGLQIGLMNIIRNNDKYFDDFPSNIAPAMTIINWRF